MNASEKRIDGPGAESPEPRHDPTPQHAPPPSAFPAGPGPSQQPRGWSTGHGLDAEPRRKSPPLACLLSVVPGLGQIYVGYYGLGFLHAIVVATLMSVMSSIGSGSEAEQVMPMLVVFFIFFMLYNIVDAGRRATLYNQALAGAPGVELPKEMRMPRPGGSIFGGVALMIGGLLLLLHTKFDFSLEWVGEWWPIAPMLFGAYLVYRAVQDRTKS